ncbi:MAG: PAS domain-containing protein [Roseovarius sp.]|nr:PAS domain-containing protein [Roseovarius sp.]
MQDDVKSHVITARPGSETARQGEHMRAFRAYWNSMRKGHDVPRRSDIDPRRIEPLLSNAFIAERIAPGVTRLRIAGMHLSDLMGMEVRGMPLSSFIAPADRDAFALNLVDVFDRPAALRLDLRSKASLGRPELTGTLLMLPLRSDLGDVSRALGCVVTQGQIGRASRRFEIVNSHVEPLVAGIESSGMRALPGGLAERTGAAPQAPTHRSARDYLRVIK